MFVPECEIPKFSHEPRPDFSFFLLYLHTLLRAFLACPTLGSSRILERLPPFPTSFFPHGHQRSCPSVVATPLANFCQNVGATQPWFHWEKGICQRQEHFVSQPSSMSPLIGHKESSEPSVLFPRAWKSTRCSQSTPRLGTSCLCEQKER